jgi:hypothetical protein
MAFDDHADELAQVGGVVDDHDVEVLGDGASTSDPGGAVRTAVPGTILSLTSRATRWRSECAASCAT